MIDYHSQKFEEQLSAIDVVFDTVGGQTRSWGVLDPAGRMVTIASDRESASDPRIKDAFFIVEPKGNQLARIGAMLNANELQVVIDAAVPFNQAGLAYTKKVQPRLGRGKTVIAVQG